MLIIIGSAALFFGLGFGLAAMHYSSEARRATKRWLAKEKRLRQDLDRIQTALVQAEEKAAALEGELTDAREGASAYPAEVKKLKEVLSALESRVARLREENARLKEDRPVEISRGNRTAQMLRQVYEDFGPSEPMGLQFQYSFPDQIILTDGQGYIRNRRDELLPEAEALQCANSAVGYAMEGLFRLFDVVYQGREYSFEEIMAGRMKDSFVTIRAVLACAKVRPTGQQDVYTLEEKGKLEVADM